MSGTPSLPSDAASPDPSLPSDVDASLPSDVETEQETRALTSSKRVFCKIDCRCGDNVPKRAEGMNMKERLDNLFAVMVEREKSGKRHFEVDGVRVCRDFFIKYHNTHGNTLANFVRDIRNGHKTRPAVHTNKGMTYSSKKADRLNSWFLSLYSELAEPLAIPDDDPRLIDFGFTPIDSLHPLSCCHVNLDGQKMAAKRYLNPGITGWWLGVGQCVGWWWVVAFSGGFAFNVLEALS